MPNFDFEDFMAWVEYRAGEREKPLTMRQKLAHLATLQGGEYLVRAYEYLLRRKVDRDGFANYSRHTSSALGRMRIFCSLLLSEECEYTPAFLASLNRMRKKREHKSA